MSSRQRTHRQQAERERSERDQERLAALRRRRVLSLVGVLAAVAAVVSVGVLVMALTARDDAGSAEDPQVENTELLASEASADEQASEASEAMAAGRVLAEDYTLDGGTPVPSDERPLPDDRPVACGAEVPANAYAPRPRYPGGPAEVLRNGVDYIARIDTSCGPITIDLFEKDAPVAVNSFVFLAEEGFYDGLEVFRDFGAIAAAQTGSGDNTVTWDIGYRLPDELDHAEREGYPIGTVTTVGEGPYTAGSQFLIAYGKEFDAGYPPGRRTRTAFGRVLSGMEIIDRMTAMERLGMGAETYAKRLHMESVTIGER